MAWIREAAVEMVKSRKIESTLGISNSRSLILRIGCTRDGKAEIKQGMTQSTDECQQEALLSRLKGTTGGCLLTVARQRGRTMKGVAWRR